MKMIAPFAEPAVVQRTVCHVINIAKRLDAQLFFVPSVAHRTLPVQLPERLYASWPFFSRSRSSDR
jgi:hypothetical protein